MKPFNYINPDHFFHIRALEQTLSTQILCSAFSLKFFRTHLVQEAQFLGAISDHPKPNSPFTYTMLFHSVFTIPFSNILVLNVLGELLPYHHCEFEKLMRCTAFLGTTMPPPLPVFRHSNPIFRHI